MPKYTEDDMQNVIDAVQGGTAAHQAARDWGVPLSTLSTRVKGAHPKGLYQAEVQQKLLIEQEQHLANWIRNQEVLGVPVKHTQIRIFATRLAGPDRTGLILVWSGPKVKDRTVKQSLFLVRTGLKLL
jgi:hypothetical protein